MRLPHMTCFTMIITAKKSYQSPWNTINILDTICIYLKCTHWNVRFNKWKPKSYRFYLTYNYVLHRHGSRFLFTNVLVWVLIRINMLINKTFWRMFWLLIVSTVFLQKVFLSNYTSLMLHSAVGIADVAFPLNKFCICFTNLMTYKMATSPSEMI